MSAMQPSGWHSRGYLPHFNGGDVPQMVTFRLAGSLPADLVTRLQQALQREAKETTQAAVHREIERHLDVGSGCNWLRQPAVASVVEQAMLHFDDTRCALLAWCIMPNHVHGLMVPRPPHDISRILFSWKSFTAKKCNSLLGRQGAFWDADYYDRFIRNEEHLANAIDYIEMNPVKAGLCRTPDEWRWSSAYRRR